ncbi:GNAT family N-acetyltransferase [Thauera butanivorans]|uniref:GNAT family N-acetyltransferase n=1 Tax=Thauera butanivorans TaxID=86174 RepID=UPI003AB6C5D9
MPLTVRQESPSDIPAIHALIKAAFLNAPHTAHTEHFIVDALREAGALAISLVAEDDGGIVGHVAVSPISISNGVAGWYGLGPIAVSPDRQRQGIGSKLMRSALQDLEGRGASGCVLVGDPAYYSKFGFKHQDSLTYPDLPPEYFQVIAFSHPVPPGIAIFHRAFDAKG